MAAQFKHEFSQNLRDTLKIHYCPDIVFSEDNLANVISIALFDGETPYNEGGTVSATCINPDGSTVPIENGAISGNVVTVSVTKACVAIPGQIQVFVKLTSGDVTTTIFAGVFSAMRTETDKVIDPGTIMPSIASLIKSINDAVGSIPVGWPELTAKVEALQGINPQKIKKTITSGSRTYLKITFNPAIYSPVTFIVVAEGGLRILNLQMNGYDSQSDIPDFATSVEPNLLSDSVVVFGDYFGNRYEYAEVYIDYEGTGTLEFIAATGNKQATTLSAYLSKAGGLDPSLKTGVDLTKRFENEIGNGDPWTWIKSRIDNGNFVGLHIGDYVPVTCTNGHKFNARIAGINTYKGYGNPMVGNHIDFVSDTLWPTAFKMNLANFNNGLDADHPYPWLCSNGYHYINSLAGNVPNGASNMPATEAVDYTTDGVYYFLPDALKSVIVEKLLMLPKRFSASAIQINDNGNGWINAGKLWLPSEVELAGTTIWGDSQYGASGFVQYALFANNISRIDDRRTFWLLSTRGGSSGAFVVFRDYRFVSQDAATSERRAPICFRVA